MGSIGVVFGTTGGKKILRAIRSFRRMEPDVFPIHVVCDISSKSWASRDKGVQDWLERQPFVKIKHVENHAHINGCLNASIRYVKELGFEHACLFHDDLVFSHLPEHRHSISCWFNEYLTRPYLIRSSGIRFSHFETFVPDVDSRRHPDDWDKEDLESDELWTFLKGYTMNDGTDCRPPGRSFWFKYEGPDKVRKWNRLGPTGQIVPIATWDLVGGFDEKEGIFYDGEYPSECFLRKLPPIWAVTNFPYIHLHNQSMNPWLDPAPDGFSDTMKAYARRFPHNHDKPEPWAAFWGDNWEEEWKD